MDNYETRVKLIGETLVDALPNAPALTPANLKTYVWSLSDLPIQAVEIAIQRTIETHKFGSIFPTIGEIREQAGAVTTEGKDGKHPASCACWGSGFVQVKVDGYNQARPCDGVVAEDADINDW